LEKNVKDKGLITKAANMENLMEPMKLYPPNWNLVKVMINRYRVYKTSLKDI